MVNGKVRGLRENLRPLNAFRDTPLNDKPKYGQGIGEAVTAFARSKASPPAGYLTNILTGKDYGGKPVTLGGQAIDMVTPMPIPDYTNLWKSDLSLARKAALSGLQFMGEGVKVYTPRDK